MLMVLLASLVCTAPAAAQHAQPALSRSPDASAGAIPSDDEATQGQAIARRATVGQHAILMAYEQCGGEQGLCNRTTIAAPCGDHPWGVECPAGYDCQRRSAALWQCTPLVGKGDSADQGPTRFTTAPKGSEADKNANGQSVVVPVTVGGNASTSVVPPLLPGGLTAAAAAGQQPANSSEEVTPAVKGCPAGQFSVGNRCFKSAGSSRRAVTGTLAGSVALLTVWQVAVLLLTALLAC